MTQHLTEEDLEKIFITSRFKKRNPFLVFLGFLGIFILFFVIISYLLNFSAFNQKIAWWYHDEFSNTQTHLLSDIVSDYQTTTITQKPELTNIPDNSIFIESINIKAPIIFGVKNDERSVSDNLKNGTIQLAGTSLPGEMGNVFITAHSSNYPWVRSSYNATFALLSNVVVGDLVQVKFHDVSYIYRVKRIFVVDPNDASVLESDKNSAVLTLMTCTPIGTNLRRLIIQADQIIPTISQNSQPKTDNQLTMPAGIR